MSLKRYSVTYGPNQGSSTEGIWTDHAQTMRNSIYAERPRQGRSQEIMHESTYPYGRIVEVYGSVAFLEHDGVQNRLVNNLRGGPTGTYTRARTFVGLYALNEQTNPQVLKPGTVVDRGRPKMYNPRKIAIPVGSILAYTSATDQLITPDSSYCKQAMPLPQAQIAMVTALSEPPDNALASRINSEMIRVGGGVANAANAAACRAEYNKTANSLLLKTAYAKKAIGFGGATEDDWKAYDSWRAELSRCVYVPFAVANEDIGSGSWGLVDLIQQ